MAASASLMAMPLSSYASQNRRLVQKPSSEPIFSPLSTKKSVVVKSKSRSGAARFRVEASLKEKAMRGITAAALTASMVVPQVAEAAGSGVSPSLKNFLLSIGAGGVVLVVIIGAVIGVSNFDPVKRG